MNTDKTRFDEWKEVVDCNDCARYWDNSCDGVDKGSQRLCTSFLATRKVLIPPQIESLRMAVKRLYAYIIAVSVLIILTNISILIHLGK